MTVIVSGHGARNLVVYGTAHDELYSTERAFGLPIDRIG
jgi:hypothetical protein